MSKRKGADSRPAVRRKFFELYLIPSPPHTSLSRTSSPTASPSRLEPTSPLTPALALSPSAIVSDPFTHILLELVKLVQSALVLWGMVSDRMEIDGLFCDETKAGVFAWRRSMGMEHEESMRLEVSLLYRVDRLLLIKERDQWRLHRSQNVGNIVELHHVYSVPIGRVEC